ncbi:MAG: hypothetical protein MUE40_04645 [Anaerolineae bacterium]|nr:hypothetical protein [Anaerolineae bacterium]
MLLRVYRLTDRTGLLLIKSSIALGDWLLEGTGAARRAVARAGGGLLSLLLTLLVLLLGGVQLLLTGVIRLLRALLRGGRALLAVVGRVMGYAFSGAKVVATAGAGTVRPATSSDAIASPARRRSRRGSMVLSPDEDVRVKVAPDPLKIQNRRLSVLVLVLGAVVIGAVLWATDPSRTTDNRPLAVVPAGAGSSLILGETPVPTQENAVISLATPFPTATPQPLALRAGGTIAYTVRERGQTDIHAVGVGSTAPLRLLNDVADERDPAWSADGSRLAYASRQDGNWEIYVYDLASQATSRITFDLSFQANPTWSNDGLWLAYESYQGNNLDVYAVPLDGSDAPVRITDHESPDFSPAWSPDGRRIAFVSWRDGNQDIYIFDLDSLETFNLTATPTRQEDYPAWSADGSRIAFSAVDAGREKVFVQSAITVEPAQVMGLGRTPSWSPDGSALTYMVDADDRSQTYIYAVPYNRAGSVPAEVVSVLYGATAPVWSAQPLPPALINSGGLELAVREPLFVEQWQTYEVDAPYRLTGLPNVQVSQSELQNQVYLSDRVNDSYNALRTRLAEVTGVDFLGRLEDAYWTLERLPEPGEERRNWHMTGRAFSIARAGILGFPAPMEIVREDSDIQTLWRVYVRVAEEAQDGQFGEPLRRMPWDFLSRTGGDVQAYNEGGRLKARFPVGYYVDLTQLVLDYGWERYPAGADWRANTNSINYWLFYKPEGLTWCAGMLELHTAGQLVNFNCTPGA